MEYLTKCVGPTCGSLGHHKQFLTKLDFCEHYIPTFLQKHCWCSGVCIFIIGQNDKLTGGGLGKLTHVHAVIWGHGTDYVNPEWDKRAQKGPAWTNTLAEKPGVNWQHVL